jgi:hypothetical protein
MTAVRDVSVFVMLPAVDFDHQLCAMAGKICDVMPDRHLPTEMMFFEALAQQPPHSSLCGRHLAPEAACPRDRTNWRMMFQNLRPTSNITPP